MDCRCNCAYASIIIGILSGVILGVLYALGFVGTGIIFWIYLAMGVLGALLSPVYSGSASCREGRCFCRFRTLILASVIGTLISSAVGLIVAPVAATVAVAVLLGVATLFAVMLIVSALCLTDCNCGG